MQKKKKKLILMVKIIGCKLNKMQDRTKVKCRQMGLISSIH